MSKFFELMHPWEKVTRVTHLHDGSWVDDFAGIRVGAGTGVRAGPIRLVGLGACMPQILPDTLFLYRRNCVNAQYVGLCRAQRAVQAEETCPLPPRDEKLSNLGVTPSSNVPLKFWHSWTGRYDVDTAVHFF